VIAELQLNNIETDELLQFKGISYSNQIQFLDKLRFKTNIKENQFLKIIEIAEKDHFYIDPEKLNKIKQDKIFSENKIHALSQLVNRAFSYKWEIKKQLATLNGIWKFKPQNKVNKSYNKELKSELEYLFNTFRVD
jgi:hypothetical protein